LDVYGVNETTGVVEWVCPVGLGSSKFMTFNVWDNITTHESTIFVSATGRVLAIDGLTGKIIWNLFETESFKQISVGTLNTNGSTLFISTYGTQTSMLYYIDTLTGKIMQTVPINRDSVGPNWLLGSSGANMMYYANDNVEAYNLDNGTLEWVYNTTQMTSMPAIYKDHLFFGSNKTLFVLNATNGNMMTSMKFADTFLANPTVDSAGNVYATIRGLSEKTSLVYSLALESNNTFSTNWIYKSEDMWLSTQPILGIDGNILVATSKNLIFLASIGNNGQTPCN